MSRLWIILQFVLLGLVAASSTPAPAQVLPPGFGPRPEVAKEAQKQQPPPPKRQPSRKVKSRAETEQQQTTEKQPEGQPPPAEAAKPAPGQQPAPPPQPAAPEPGTPPAAESPAPAPEAAAPAPPETGGAQAETAEAPPAPRQPRTPTGSLSLNNASLTEVVDALCRQLKLNYIIDPTVKGGVILNTYGDTSKIDARELLDLILRINGAAMIKSGEIYRIVPMANAPRMPIPPEVNPKNIMADEQVMLSLIFLKYVTVEELVKLVEPFIGEGAVTWAYPPANLLLIMDNRRNMRRTLDLINLFDSDALATQRVRLFETEHRRPSELAVEIETVLKSISLTEDSTPIRFLPIDRLNLIVAVAPNPGAFETVEEWLAKLDQPVKVTAGTIDNYVYRVKYRRAEALAAGIMRLYGGFAYGGAYGSQFGLFTGAASGFGNRYSGGVFGGGGYGGYGGGGYGGYGGGGYGGYGGGGYGGYGGYGGGGYGGYGGYGGGGYGGGYPGAYGGGYGAAGYPGGAAATGQAGTTSGTTQLPASFASPAGGVAGSYPGGGGYGTGWGRIPMVIPNPLDNSLLIQGTPEEYRQIIKLLEELDTPPRQVLVDAKIYEVTLTGAFAAGVSTFLRQRQGESGGPSVSTLKPLGSITPGGLAFTVGALVDESRELLSFLEAKENTTRAKVIAAPTLIATDNIPASINVGSEVPVLTAQAVSPIQSGGSSLFTNSVSNRDSGVTLSVLARVNPSGIVTLVIDQEVSAPQPPPAGGIQSPSFSKRTIQTQVTVRDGDTIAIGGIINESETQSTGGFPGLHRLPVVGYAFGVKSKSKQRTELVIFMTPRVIYDTNQITEASDEMKTRFRKLVKILDNSDE